MVAKRKTSQKVRAKQKSNGNRNTEALSSARRNENRLTALAELFANHAARSEAPGNEFPVRLAALLARSPESLAFDAHDIADLAVDLAKVLGQSVGPEDEVAAGLAAHLAREPASRGISIDELTRHALEIAQNGFAASRALEAGQSAKPAIAKARAVIRACGAETIDSSDDPRFVLGVRLSSNASNSDTKNIFCVV